MKHLFNAHPPAILIFVLISALDGSPVFAMSQSLFPAERTFEVVYQGRVIDIPADARQIRVWIPLARSRENQTILEREIDIPIPYELKEEPLHGNELLYFDINRPKISTIPFRIRYVARIEENNGRVEAPADASLYLKPSRLMRVTDEVKGLLRKAVTDEDPLKVKARKIFDGVIQHMAYDKSAPGWGEGDTLRACLVGKGNCTDFHSLFISMAQAAHIPARFEIGMTIPQESEGMITGYHCWVRYLEGKAGWRQVDASEAWKHPERKEAYFGNNDTNKFLLSVGRDIPLVPPQHGEPVNILFYPYVEADGKVFRNVETTFSYKNISKEETGA